MRDYTGMKFGEWTVIRFGGKKTFKLKSGPHAGETAENRYLRCRCSCGLIKNVTLSNLITGASTRCKKCGYGGMEIHGKTFTREYTRLRCAFDRAKKYDLPPPAEDYEQAFRIYKPEEHKSEFLVFSDVDNKWVWSKKRPAGRTKIGNLVTVNGITNNFKDWGELLGISRERVRQLHNEHRLVLRIHRDLFNKK